MFWCFFSRSYDLNYVTKPNKNSRNSKLIDHFRKLAQNFDVHQTETDMDLVDCT